MGILTSSGTPDVAIEHVKNTTVRDFSLKLIAAMGIIFGAENVDASPYHSRKPQNLGFEMGEIEPWDSSTDSILQEIRWKCWEDCCEEDCFINDNDNIDRLDHKPLKPHPPANVLKH